MLQPDGEAARQGRLDTQPWRAGTSAATQAAWLGAMQRSVMLMRGSDTGGMRCCAMSTPLPFSARHEPAKKGFHMRSPAWASQRTAELLPLQQG